MNDRDDKNFKTHNVLLSNKVLIMSPTAPAYIGVFRSIVDYSNPTFPPKFPTFFPAHRI